MKKFIRNLLTYLFNIFGYGLAIFKKNNFTNYELVDRNVWQPFFEQNEKVKLYFKSLEVSKNSLDTNIYRELRFYNLQNCLEQINKADVKGDYVECGVWKGQSAYIIATHMLKRKNNPELHLFDSFEMGLSEKVKKDKNLREELSPERILEEKLAFSYSKDLLEENLADFNFIKIYEGWIPKRFHEVQDKTFSFVHIDVDLYEPTKESLDFFYSRLAPKGIIVCDDYNFCQFPGAKKAFDEFLENNNPSFFYEVPYGASFIIK
jgi:hypothetical protein